MLKNDVIQEAEASPWSSPVVLIRKPNGKDYRFCLDMRNLNRVTKKDSYALPRIDDTLDALHGAVFFSSVDLMSAYWQLELDEESRHLTTFCTHVGSYYFNVVPFGLVNAGASFQKLMETVLRHLQWKICLVYLDDIVIFSKSFQEHITNLDRVFQRLRGAGLKLSPDKCNFCQKNQVLRI